MVRLFHVYYPVRTLVLLTCEAILVYACFTLAAVLRLGADSYLALNYENGWAKILTVTICCILCSYYFDLYSPQRFNSRSETYFRLLLVVGVMSFILAALLYTLPQFAIANDVFLLGLGMLTVTLVLWRACYQWLMKQPILRERVYIIGDGVQAQHVVEAIRRRSDLGMELIGWAGGVAQGSSTHDAIADQVRALGTRLPVDRVILGLSDRRGAMPVRELLNLRLTGVKIDDASSVLEKIQGKIELDGLHPSAMIFAEGFKLNASFLFLRRLLSLAIALVGLLICLPVIPLVALLIKLTSPGSVFFRQERVGRKGEIFNVYKFRTMCENAEASTGAVWAGKHDPRVTPLGRFLRKTRLDEIPQLWNVLTGDMAFVGPRPERPEFVQWLTEKIPYYNLRHIIRPGLTGWAQVRYNYGASLEETKQKLEYDLYYIKHMSLTLDLFIVFETVKTVVLRRGAQ